MNIYKLKFTVLQQEILRLLYVKSDISFTERGVAKALKVSPTAVSNSLKALEKEKLVTVAKDVESRRLSIKLNRDNSLVIGFKRADNLKQIYESGLANFLEDSFPGANIIFFGSYSRGDDTVSSDIDIAIIGKKEKNIDLKPFENMLYRKISLNFYASMSK